MKKLIFICLLAFGAMSCSDMFDPAAENRQTLDAIYTDPGKAYGILINAYVQLPYRNSVTETDIATSDGVTNNQANAYLKMSQGSWTSVNNPINQWNGRRNAIQSVNEFLENVDKVTWAHEPVLNQLFKDRTTGEAYAMRALQLFYLIKAHAGYTESGELLGAPIVNVAETASSDFNTPRATAKECIAQINADLDKALEYLPLDYSQKSFAEVPQKYKDLGLQDESLYNRVFGTEFEGLLSGRIVKVIKSQLALWAASPAYAAGTDVTYEQAADLAGEVLSLIGGVAGIDPIGNTWYCNQTQLNALTTGECPKEMVWRGTLATDNTMEKELFPPTLYGSGRVNPSQNFVDAFPMANGYPITDATSAYDKTKPYEGRDPRLAKYVIYNGSTQGVGNKVITTAADGSTSDALNKENGKSTRTGYYLRKFTRNYVNIDPNNSTKEKGYTVRIRYTEIFLNYAEAANEAYGPTAGGTHGISAYDVVKAIRERAGITGGDAYLESIKSDKDAMRELIRNERRIELCFENHRFWDLRRWKVDLDTFNEEVKGMSIIAGTYNSIEVETRSYQDYMYYGPIPYGEVQKFSALEQNAGW